MSRSSVKSWMSALLCVSLGVCLLVCFVQSESHTHEGEGHKGSQDEKGEGQAQSDVQKSPDGSEEKAKEPQVPKEVRVERLKVLAEQQDQNGDGYIDMDELSAWVHDSITNATIKDAAGFFGHLDTNKDGKVDIAELFKEFYGKTVEDLEKLREKVKRGNSESVLIYRALLLETKRLAAADLDNDTFLNATEILGYYDPIESPHMHDSEVEQAIFAFDADQDQQVSEEEFIADEKDEKLSALKKSVFGDLDKDKNGFLNHEESKPWILQPRRANLAKDEAKLLMEEADLDKDKKLSMQELIDKEEFFGPGGPEEEVTGANTKTDSGTETVASAVVDGANTTVTKDEL